MNYAEIKPFDIANAPNVCCTIFFSGCSFNCKNCFNKEIQDFNYGKEFTREVMDDFIEKASNPQVKNICLLGGDPFQQDFTEMLRFLQRLNCRVKKPIWVWTGYTFEEIENDILKSALLQYIDVLVDGRFVQELKDLNLKYRGSSNQRIIDISKTLSTNQIVLWEK